MYFNEVAAQTADHLRTHVAAYAQAIELERTPKLAIETPKLIDVINLIAGTIELNPQRLPVYAINAFDKTKSDSSESLYSYIYAGTIAGIVSHSTSDGADALAKLHEVLIETFIQDHQFLHQYTTTKFSILEFAFSAASFTETTEMKDPKSKSIWLAGFSMDVAWLVSEAGSRQH